MTAILGNLLKQGFKLRQSIEQENVSPFLLQKKQLLRLLFRAKATEFGKFYQFDKIIEAIRKAKKRDKSFYHTYTQQVPIFDYDTIYQHWWSRARENGERNVAWRGGVKYYTLSSGTSGSPSKHIPVTRDMIRAIHRTGIRQLLALSNFNIPGKIYSKGILMLGGSTQLNKVDSFFEGDLSGITTSQIPFWFQHLFYKPGRRIARNTNWDAKLQEITEQASKWDIGYIAGVPAWIQMLMERIVQHYKLNNIHDIWPNLTAYAYGGVSIEPYRKGFEKVLGRPLHFIETYLASEGFIAYQMYPGQNLRLVLNNGIFHEFIPFNTENFGPDGELIGNPKTLMIDEIEEGKNYALLISTCAGAWSYLIDDTIMFTNKSD
ncbi:MAG TPA: GH3 auxin-responsive promoter, partial [Microscillaceae bacterium]|nr:GH3 auxin-responsive promoter [Microscillaceae bacterium]